MEYSTEFLERVQRTASSESYRFKMPENFSFIAGQYMLVDLGDDLARPLSLSSCSQENRFIEFTKRMIASPYCSRLQSLQRGDSIRVVGPFGEFCSPDLAEPLVLIAGGIGITPIRSILTSLEKRGGETILIYGNQNREDIAFRDELEKLSLPQYHVVHVLSDATGMENAYQGFINADILAREIPPGSSAQYMVSGPPVMVAAITKGLAGIGIGEERVRTDVFLGYDR